MRVYVELPPGWGPGQAIITDWIRVGYDVQDERIIGTGERRLIVRGVAPSVRDSSFGNRA